MEPLASPPATPWRTLFRLLALTWLADLLGSFLLAMGSTAGNDLEQLQQIAFNQFLVTLVVGYVAARVLRRHGLEPLYQIGLPAVVAVAGGLLMMGLNALLMPTVPQESLPPDGGLVAIGPLSSGDVLLLSLVIVLAALLVRTAGALVGAGLGVLLARLGEGALRRGASRG